MDVALSLLVGALFSAAIYLMLSRHIIRLLLGVALLGNAVNLLIFTSGRLTAAVPPVIPEGAKTASDAIANPLPQALVLTAIVISFSFFAYLMVLAYRAYEELGTDDTQHMRLAEPATHDQPPTGY